ncbi:BnaCnng20100D [Brassica napus]|uniref:BnaCnng20100D protein n=1 Tax=Brassica napus TaxID=3708 RepID=A0A078IME8_BRANA|nr:BnaCnng20100D [Brassica napus]
MVTTSSSNKSNTILRYSKAVPSSSSSAFASSTSSTFSSPSSSFFHHRSSSPTPQPMSQSFRYSLDTRSISPTNHRSISVSKKPQPKVSETTTASPSRRRRCMCSPTTHPGSFRCSLHKNVANPHGQGTASFTGNSLNMRRSAMTNSLVRIGGVEGEWVRRALTTLIRPSSHHLRRRAAFQPRPSRLSVMTDLVGKSWIGGSTFVLFVDPSSVGRSVNFPGCVCQWIGV